MKNIILIGMPGAGKSTVGVVLAKILGKDFEDIDLIIQRKEKRRLQNIIDSDGLQKFLEIEENALLDADFNNTVIATGGSAVMSEKGMLNLKKSSTVVYLKLSLEAITKRIHNLSSRGIAMEKGQTISDIFEIRRKLYEKYADIVIDCENCSIEQVIEKIRTALV
ncbi:MAG: shikimate kinase [Clostridia bacterium]|nr:shikimate kinase [Clostridia bacterium]